MLARRELLPHVLEINYQARRRLGCSVYLIHDEGEWLLLDIGYEDTVEEIVEMIRQLDFGLAQCKYLVATHADVDHVQGMKQAKKLLPSGETVGHPDTVKLMAEGDPVMTYSEITAQGISIDFPRLKLDRAIDEGDTLKVGNVEIEVWHTPGHTNGQLSFKMGDVLFCGDNIYRDGCVGNIDAHHGSDIPDFIESLRRIRNSDVNWLCPSHGPIFRKNDEMLDATIARLEGYQHMADFGTCAVDWPLLDQWDEELIQNIDPKEVG